MYKGNKGWWEFPRWSHVYEKGTDEYIEKAFVKRSQGNQISCPCCICHHRYWYGWNDVKDHIICNGFVPRSDEFSGFGSMGVEIEMEGLEHEPLNMNDGIQELMHDTVMVDLRLLSRMDILLLERTQTIDWYMLNKMMQ